MSKQGILTWGQEAPPYRGANAGGLALYREGVELLDDGYKDCEASRARETKFRRIAFGLSAMTILLAAAAGVTTLPSGIARVVPAVIAFLATAVGLFGVCSKPDNQASAARTDVVLWIQLRDDVKRCLSKINGLPAGASTTDVEQELLYLQARRDAIKSKA